MAEGRESAGWRGRLGTNLFEGALVLGVALAARFLHLVGYSRSPYFRVFGLDAMAYREMALGFVRGSWPDRQAFFWPPLYPLFEGLLYRLGGDGFFWLRGAQAVIGAFSCLLVWLIARRLFGAGRTALLAGFIAALTGTMIFHDGELLSAGLDVFLTLLAAWLLLEAPWRGAVLWGLAGVAMGLATINRGGMVLFLPVALIWLVISRAAGWRVRALGTAALLCGLVAVVLPVVVHNFRYDLLPPTRSAAPPPAPKGPLGRIISGDFVPIASAGGATLYLGNDPAMAKLLDPNEPRAFTAYNDVYRDLYRRGGPTASSQDRYLRRRALEAASRDIPAWLRLMGRKVLLSLNGAEIPRNANLYAQRRWSPVLRILLWRKLIAFPSGLLIPLGLGGIVLILPGYRRHLVMLGLIASQFLVLWVFLTGDRYRLPLLALLAPYAAWMIAAVARYAARRAPRGTGLALIVTGLMLVVANLPLVEVRTEPGYWEDYFRGVALARRGRLDEAFAAYERALAINPAYAGARVSLAAVLLWRGRADEALEQYGAALAAEPENAEAHQGMGDILLARGDRAGAAQHYRAALDARPYFAPARAALARLDMM